MTLTCLPSFPASDFLGLVNSGLTYSAMDNTLSETLPLADRLNSLGGWRPDPNKVQVAITRGAGQYRALGRVVALTRLDEIKRRVDRAVDALTDVDVDRQLGRLSMVLGQGEPRAAVPEPTTIVVSSIAGGSGAGAVMEVCDVVRAAGRTWLDESVGILYAPDVFDDIPEAARRGVRPNALATLSELIAGSRASRAARAASRMRAHASTRGAALRRRRSTGSDRDIRSWSVPVILACQLRQPLERDLPRHGTRDLGVDDDRAAPGLDDRILFGKPAADRVDDAGPDRPQAASPRDAFLWARIRTDVVGPRVVRTVCRAVPGSGGSGAHHEQAPRGPACR